MKHLTDDQLSARLDRSLAGHAREEADRHLAACARCRDALAGLGAQDRVLGAALAHEPGDAYFETFAARVEDRLRAEGLRGAQARLGEDRWFGWLRGPRRVAWAAVMATVVAGAAIVLITTRDAPLPTAADRDLERRIAQRELSQTAPAPAPDAAPGTDAGAPPSGGALESAPTEPGSRSLTMRDEARQQAGATEPGAAGSAQNQVATPTRMREVRRDGSRSTADATRGVQQTSPGPAATAVPEGGVRVARRGGAQPAAEKLAAPAPPSEEAPAPTAFQSAPTEQQELAPPAEALRAGTGTRGSAPPLAGGLADAPRAGEVRLCGMVVDSQGRPVARASITLVALGRTAASDEAGAFCLAAPAGSYELSAMAVGFTPARMQVRVAGEQADVRVTLRPISVLGEGFAKAPPPSTSPASELSSQKTSAARPAPARPQPAKAVDPFAGEPKALATRIAAAREASRAASVYPTVPTWDKAAASWKAVLGDLTTPAGRTEANYRIAQARLGSWRLFPTAGRRNEVLAACSAVLAGSPTLEQRRDVMKWMSEVRRGPTGRG